MRCFARCQEVCVLMSTVSFHSASFSTVLFTGKIVLAMNLHLCFGGLRFALTWLWRLPERQVSRKPEAAKTSVTEQTRKKGVGRMESPLSFIKFIVSVVYAHTTQTVISALFIFFEAAFLSLLGKNLRLSWFETTVPVTNATRIGIKYWRDKVGDNEMSVSQWSLCDVVRYG